MMIAIVSELEAPDTMVRSYLCFIAFFFSWNLSAKCYNMFVHSSYVVEWNDLYIGGLYFLFYILLKVKNMFAIMKNIFHHFYSAWTFLIGTTQ